MRRINSTQSVRIRNLETEVSRLLAENVSLREQVIKIQYEAESGIRRSDRDKVYGVKRKLQERLGDIACLLEELEEVGITKERPGRDARKAKRPSPTSMDERQSREGAGLADTKWEAEGRLPPILENKALSRKTLEYAIPASGKICEVTFTSTDELRDILNLSGNMTDSPELGPPPVAHFDEEGPITFGSKDPEKPKSLESDTSEMISSNLEVRRRRRESFHKEEVAGTIPVKSSGFVKAATPAALTRTSKLEEERKGPAKDVSDTGKRDHRGDDFDFTRKNADTKPGVVPRKNGSQAPSAESKRPDNKPLRDPGQQEKAKEANRSTVSNARKPLGPKSANVDPKSPVKNAGVDVKHTLGGIKGKSGKAANDGNQARDKQVANKYPREAKREELSKAVSSNTTDRPPKTPVTDLDLFSPTISDPSEPRPDLQDTPPPPDLDPDSATGSFGRGSRRSRGSVSYTEPNLRAKMRRPTKELIDAVGVEERNRQASAAGKDGSEVSLEAELEKLNIGQESEGPSKVIWRTKPIQESKSQQQRQETESNSPLGKKVSMQADEVTAVPNPKSRSDSSLEDQHNQQGARRALSGAAPAIATLSNVQRGNTNFKHKLDARDSGDAASDVADNGHIFDFTSSSPEHSHHENREEVDGVARPMRVSRRHSTSISGPAKASITITRRRRESSLAPGYFDEPNQDVGPELKSTNSISALGDDATKEGSEGIRRGERAASRRRSMML